MSASLLNSPNAEQYIDAGLCFGSCEVLLRQGPAKQYLRSIFKRNEDLKKNLDDTITQAITRIIGFLHVAIQVCNFAHCRIFGLAPILRSCCIWTDCLHA